MSSSSPVLSPLHELDKISQLPDDILLQVLFTLDLKNAVQTSILAKRWRYLWTWLTDLDFDSEILSSDNSDEIEPQRYLNWVDQVVNAHRSPCIRKFRVLTDFEWSIEKSQVEKWARFAFSKRVEELDLDLEVYPYCSRFSLGYDLLKHPRDNGIANLKSLRLSSVDLSGETLEFILLQCHLLELLYVKDSKTLHTLNIMSYKLKHLTLIRCCHLKKLEIDALNLISFHFEDDYGCVPTHMAFNSVPKLIEVGCDGEGCFYPFPLLEQISCLSKQLTKLSFSPSISYHPHFDISQHFHTPMKFDVLFANVKQLTLTVAFIESGFVKRFIDACPILHELKLQICNPYTLKEEAKQLREIELKDERNDEQSMDQNSNTEAHKENVEHGEYEKNQSYPNLKVLEVVGFHGCDTEVEYALRIIASANSLETLIWNPRHSHADLQTSWVYEDVEKIDTIKRRARKLAKLLPPKVRVGVRDKSGIFWAS